jgi:hypothetical protein
MGTDTYVRENQEAFDAMYDNAIANGMSEEDAYKVSEE